jgi:hypothetical protein
MFQYQFSQYPVVIGQAGDVEDLNRNRPKAEY